ncbi:hypothetical protein AY599_21900 [Leptolyngbya valderiana BDU 20041]|nr:hypothetical protein AY599_21900 [Leptolyngbya valderiana BDU 20041]
MLIDWFTVGVQLFNFLFLVWLLQRVLYRPILQTIERRQQRIDQWYRDAEQQREEARQNAERYRRQCRELQEFKAKHLAEAKQQARREREILTQQAKQDVDRLHRQWKTALRRRQAQFFDRLQRDTSHHLALMTRRALEDVAGAKLEDRAIERFLDRLHHLDDATRQQMHACIADSRASVLICTGFEISQETRDRLLDAVRRELAWDVELCEADELPETEDTAEEKEPRPVPLQFVRDRAPICGIELYTGGYEVAWSFDSYLRDLEDRVRQTLQSELERVEEEEPLPEERLQRQLAQQTYDIARRALQDVADETLERRTIAMFLQRWERLDDDTQKQLARSLSEGNRSICVRSSFEIPPEWKQEICDRLHQAPFTDSSTIDFQQSRDLICGIEVQIDGHEIAWSLDDYLEQLRGRVEATLT